MGSGRNPHPRPIKFIMRSATGRKAAIEGACAGKDLQEAWLSKLSGFWYWLRFTFLKKKNPDGKTVFIENHADWIGFQPPEVKHASPIVKYSSNYSESLENIHDEQMLAKF